MIYIFTKNGCQGSKKALKWLQQHQLPHQHKLIKDLDLKNLIQILSLTDSGFDQILVGRSPAPSFNTKQVTMALEEASDFSEAVQIIHKNPNCFKSPIIIDEKKIQVGFHDDEIRKFLSPEFRRLERKKIG